MASEDEKAGTEVVVDNKPPEVSMASSIIPYDMDDAKALYFSWRSCGLDIRETLEKIDRTKSWLSTCRLDPEFVSLEKRIPEFRRTLSKEYIELDTVRNYRLILDKDCIIVKRSLGMEKDKDGNVVPMSKADNDYLNKMRTLYTPQHLAILETLVNSGGTGLDWTKWIADHTDEVEISRTDSIKMKRSVSAEQT